MKHYTGLAFLFTKNDFMPDTADDASTADEWYTKFKEHKFEALYEWGFQELPDQVHPSALFLHRLAEAYLDTLTACSELEVARDQLMISVAQETWEKMEAEIPFVLGSEFITYEWVTNIFHNLHQVFQREIKAYTGSVKLYLAEKNQNLRVPERIFFHLVESKDENFPFAFMATYATKDQDGAIRHMPLRYALEEYKQDKEHLLRLLSCLNQAAKCCTFLSSLMEHGELFHPLRLDAKEAYELLCHTKEFETCGIMCRIPNWWRKKYASVSVTMKMGEQKPSLLGFDSILSITPELTVNGVALSEDDVQQLLMQSEGLAFLKGKWVEVNHQKLQALLKQMEKKKRVDITLMDAIRSNLQEKGDPDNGIQISNGKWLNTFLYQLRYPKQQKDHPLPHTVCATLRPYQKIGYDWLNQMHQYGFGACLADDMGLGKTLQVLCFLEQLRCENPQSRVLLIVPASLLANWEREAHKFTPDLDFHILHGKGSALLEKELQEEPAFLTVTTYGMSVKLKGLCKLEWDCIVLDEAQAIKNPLTKQTKAIKQLKGHMRIAMSGTPIENDLSNLWSLFDFLNKGLLGSANEFKTFTKKLTTHPQGYQKLKAMIAPFILRRLKTDKSIIHDLPQKVEVDDYVNLSKQQVVLYRQLVADMETKILSAEGIEKRGLVLATLTKLKQICNHPDQYMGEQGYAPKNSGKFELLKEICETIYEKRERVLIFTQYKEIIPYLSAYLTKLFHQEGFIIHGGTPVKKRMKIVEQFQQEAYVPYIILSLKAAGTGLNLTAANHVIHFDRWWNPAVEDQATDRAFRIGQHKNVMVHKLISKGTIEEKIDQLIKSKTKLSRQVIGSGTETWINDLDDQALMNLLRLDVR